MQKIFWFVLIILGVAFICIQFFQPNKNISDLSSNHILQVEKVPPNIENLLTNACFDCHSNSTQYLWYHKVAPVSWIVNEHVIDGKKELNFSEWGQMDVFTKITILEEVCQETGRKTMPLKSYKLIHPKSKLSDEQIEELCNWATKLSEELLAKAAEN